MARNGLPKVDRAPDQTPESTEPEVEDFRRYQLRTMPPGVRQKWLSAEPPPAAEDELFDTLPPTQGSTTDPTLITRRRASRWPAHIAIALTILCTAFVVIAVAMRWTQPPPSVTPPAPTVHPDELPPPPVNTSAKTSAPAHTSAPAKASAPAKTSAPAHISVPPSAKTAEASAHTSASRAAPPTFASPKSVAPPRLARPPAPPTAASADVDTKTPFF